MQVDLVVEYRQEIACFGSIGERGSSFESFEGKSRIHICHPENGDATSDDPICKLDEFEMAEAASSVEFFRSEQDSAATRRDPWSNSLLINYDARPTRRPTTKNLEGSTTSRRFLTADESDKKMSSSEASFSAENPATSGRVSQWKEFRDGSVLRSPSLAANLDDLPENYGQADASRLSRVSYYEDIDVDVWSELYRRFHPMRPADADEILELDVYEQMVVNRERVSRNRIFQKKVREFLDQRKTEKKNVGALHKWEPLGKQEVPHKVVSLSRTSSTTAAKLSSTTAGKFLDNREIMAGKHANATDDASRGWRDTLDSLNPLADATTNYPPGSTLVDAPVITDTPVADTPVGGVTDRSGQLGNVTLPPVVDDQAVGGLENATNISSPAKLSGDESSEELDNDSGATKRPDATTVDQSSGRSTGVENHRAGKLLPLQIVRLAEENVVSLPVTLSSGLRGAPQFNMNIFRVANSLINLQVSSLLERRGVWRELQSMPAFKPLAREYCNSSE